MNFITLVSQMSQETFAEIVSSSPRRIRETLFGRLGIKAKKKTVGLRIHAKTEERTQKLHERLKEAKTPQENELCQELVRNWLFTKRDLLKSTLDYLGVKNDNGFIDEDPVFFKELSEDKVRELVAHLQQSGFTPEHIRAYLHFVETPHLDTVMTGAA